MGQALRTFVRECVPALPRPVWIIQLGNVVNFFGFGLVLPFELIYLHDHRGFSLPLSGLIVSTIMAANVVCAGPAGSLVDRFGGKHLLVLGSCLSGLGYASLAGVTHPWQGFLASAVAGSGGGLTHPAAGTLITALSTREERVAAFTVARKVTSSPRTSASSKSSASFLSTCVRRSPPRPRACAVPPPLWRSLMC